jgi:hypothetical protein
MRHGHDAPHTCTRVIVTKGDCARIHAPVRLHDPQRACTRTPAWPAPKARGRYGAPRTISSQRDCFLVKINFISRLKVSIIKYG